MKRLIGIFLAAGTCGFLHAVTVGFIQRQAEYLALMTPAQQAFMSSCDERYPLCAELTQHEKNFSDSRELREKKVAAWVESQLRPGQKCSETVFYPFGGADALFVRAFFPRCERYVLAGLEPVGGRLLASDLSHPMRVPYVQRVRKSMRSILQRGFFVTEYLRNDLDEKRAGGVLPLLVAQLARADCKITGIDLYKVNAQGRYYAVPFPQADSESSGVQISFTEKQNPERTKQLYYFRSDLSNAAFAGGPLRSWLNERTPLATFFKSASYLPHQENFSEVTMYVLEHSTGILQDDTGIPFNRLDAALWSVEGFGEYESVIEQFKLYFQPGLRSFMQHKPALPFAVGYQAAEKHMVLLRITRKD